MKISRKDAAKLGLPVPAKRHKYGAVACVVDGIRFQSQREARRYSELKLLEAAGKICYLALQVRFYIHSACGVYVADYYADFQYRDAAGVRVVEDCKGVRTPVYRLKKKLVESEYGITITEV